MKNTKKAFLWITNILDQKEITYKISGGLAARLYGVNRDLADIDIEIADQDILSIIEDVKPYIVFGPARYKDLNWDLELMTLLYEEQEIDIAGINSKIFNQATGKWEKYPGNLNDVTIIEIYGKKVPVESIKSLITYKSKLAREVDLEDIKQLKELVAKGQ